MSIPGNKLHKIDNFCSRPIPLHCGRWMKSRSNSPYFTHFDDDILRHKSGMYSACLPSCLYGLLICIAHLNLKRAFRNTEYGEFAKPFTIGRLFWGLTAGGREITSSPKHFVNTAHFSDPFIFSLYKCGVKRPFAKFACFVMLIGWLNQNGLYVPFVL